MAFQVATISVTNCSFYGDELVPPSPVMLPIIWSRWFESVTLSQLRVNDFMPFGDSAFGQTRLFDLEIASLSISPLAVNITDCHFVNAYASSLIRVSNVPQAYFENLSFLPSPIEPDGPIGANFRILDVSFVSGSVEMARIENRGIGTVRIATVPIFRLRGSTFRWKLQPLFNRQLELSEVASAEIRGCEMALGSVVGGIVAPMTYLNVSDSRFFDSLSVGDSGSAISAENSLGVEIFNCTFFRGNSRASGGAVYATGPVSIVDSSFEGNQAEDRGGALFLSIGPILLHRCSFTLNSCPQDGGAIRLEGSGFSHIEHSYSATECNFTLNVANGDGGAVFASAFTGVISQGRFVQNTAGLTGGALKVSSGSIDVLDSNFVSNHANGPSNGGGAISIGYATFNLTHSCFENNIAKDSLGGALASQSSVHVLDTRFVRNLAKLGGAMAFIGGSTTQFSWTISDSLLEHNSADQGGAIFWDDSASQHHTWIMNSSLFRNNTASLSGGAIFLTSDYYATYSNLTFTENRAQTSGGTFFASSKSETTYDFCSTERCFVKDSTAGSWGPIRANSAFSYEVTRITPLTLQFGDSLPKGSALGTSEDANLLTSVTPVNMGPSPPPRSQVYFMDYLLDIKIKDGYKQIVEQPARIQPQSLSVRCLGEPKRSCPVKATFTPGDHSLKMSLLATESLGRSLEPFKSNTPPSPFSPPLELQLTMSVIIDDIELESGFLGLNVSLRGCPIGFGLLPSSANSTLLSCQPCPVNSYNLDGDGYCYECNAASPSHLKCEGAKVSYSRGHWEAPFNNTNLLHVGKCVLGHCLADECAPFRTGPLCGDCIDGSFQSFFGACSPTLCARRSLGLFILAPIALIVATVAFHLLLMRWPSSVLYFVLIGQLALSILIGYLDWSIPLMSDALAQFLCGYRMDFFERSLWLVFSPYSSVLVLATIWVSIVLASRLDTKCAFISRSASKILTKHHWKRLLSSILAILYVNSYWSLGHAMKWIQCKTVSFGDHWLLSPSLHCSSAEFAQSRSILLGLSLPLTILPLALVLAAAMLKAKYRSRNPLSRSHHQEAIEASRQ